MQVLLFLILLVLVHVDLLNHCSHCRVVRLLFDQSRVNDGLHVHVQADAIVSIDH